MNEFKMISSNEGVVLKGKIIDVCLMLEKEQQKYGKVSLSQYLKQKKERVKAEAESETLFVNPSYKAGN